MQVLIRQMPTKAAARKRQRSSTPRSVAGQPAVVQKAKEDSKTEKGPSTPPAKQPRNAIDPVGAAPDVVSRPSVLTESP